MLRSVQRWSDQSDSPLQDCFDPVDWDMFRIALDNKIDVYADSVSEFISKCICEVVPTVTIKNPPLIVYRRGRNLRNKLFHANCQPQKKISQALLRTLPNGSYKCRRCAQCNNMMKCEYFFHPHTGKRFEINDIIMCSTTHVIYTITCPCALCYVGKTSRSLKQRINEHKNSNRRNYRDYPVAVHLMT